ncbi:MAG TPA: glycosyltransferase family 4 protein [Opitutaceae bacterium]|nr:glycosyltransferase family 4 protein [Opitutaceae bacterium]
MSPLRVLLVTPYDLAVPSGVNRHTRDLLDALIGRGVEVRLIGPASAPVGAGDPRVCRMGRIWTRAFNGAQTRITLDWQVVPPLRRLLREFRPDVLHVQEPVAPLPCAAALWLAPRGVRRVGTFHTYSETSRDYLWTWPWLQAVRASLDVQVAVSAAAREFVGRYHRGPCVVVPHAVRLPPAAEIRPEHPPGRPVRLLFVGRMDEPRKGFGVLIDALRRLLGEQPGEYHLTAVGPGQDGWSAAAADLPVDFRGELADHELGGAYAAADLVCVPSTGGESFGLVALEALAHGVPVVATRIRGYAEWLEGSGTGELAQPGDAAGLATAVRAVTGSVEQHAACGRCARQLAQTYSWEKRIDAWLQIYRGEIPGRDGA